MTCVGSIPITVALTHSSVTIPLRFTPVLGTQSRQRFCLGHSCPSVVPTSERAESSTTDNTKVSRLIESYGLGDLGERLEEAWTGDRAERSSLRDLADRFNQQLLEAELERSDLSTLDGEVENIYRLLTDDDVSGGMRTQVMNRLERAGIDVDNLQREFVSHQAIYTYLTKVRGVSHSSTEADDQDQVKKDAQTIQRLQSRTATVTESTLERLSNTGRVSLGDFEVIVDVQVLCRDCGETRSVDTLLESGSCGCDPDAA